MQVLTWRCTSLCQGAEGYDEGDGECTDHLEIHGSGRRRGGEEERCCLPWKPWVLCAPRVCPAGSDNIVPSEASTQKVGFSSVCLGSVAMHIVISQR